MAAGWWEETGCHSQLCINLSPSNVTSMLSVLQHVITHTQKIIFWSLNLIFRWTTFSNWKRSSFSPVILGESHLLKELNSLTRVDFLVTIASSFLFFSNIFELLTDSNKLCHSEWSDQPEHVLLPLHLHSNWKGRNVIIIMTLKAKTKSSTGTRFPKDFRKHPVRKCTSKAMFLELAIFTP